MIWICNFASCAKYFRVVSMCVCFLKCVQSDPLEILSKISVLFCFGLSSWSHDYVRSFISLKMCIFCGFSWISSFSPRLPVLHAYYCFIFGSSAHGAVFVPFPSAFRWLFRIIFGAPKNAVLGLFFFAGHMWAHQHTYIEQRSRVYAYCVFCSEFPRFDWKTELINWSPLFLCPPLSLSYFLSVSLSFSVSAHASLKLF